MAEKQKQLTEEDIRRMVREEVRKQLHEMVQEIRLLAGLPQQSYPDLEHKR